MINRSRYVLVLLLPVMTAIVVIHSGCGKDGGYYESGSPREQPACATNLEYQPRYQQPSLEPNGESYEYVPDNRFQSVKSEPLSTFSIDVDTASYSILRRHILDQGVLPPPEAVRIEEMVNYFDYRYAPPTGDAPFSTDIEIGSCPWQEEHLLARIGLQGEEVSKKDRPDANLVFLIDVSGSMSSRNKLPLVQQGLRMLVEELARRDQVSIVVYAGSSGVALEPTSCRDRNVILRAISQLHAGGSTAGASGIRTAYHLAEQSMIEGGINRVILCTDGDFNVGMTNNDQLTHLIKNKADSGVMLTVLGFGMGNLKDSRLETLADHGNGSYAYIDSQQEARKVMVEQVQGTLNTIAKDVKVQVDFNPEYIDGYRLIGYENRVMENRDFANDRKDAGEIGSGHTVTAFYELVPRDVKQAEHKREVRSRYGDNLGVQADNRYIERNDAVERPEDKYSDEMFTVCIRYKRPESDRSQLLEFPVKCNAIERRPSDDFQFASAVACFGMILRESRYREESSYRKVLTLARAGSDYDPNGYRSELISLVEQARHLR